MIKTIHICRKCGVEMKEGQAIAQTFAGTPEWPGDTIYTLYPAGPGVLVDCLKCPQCGYSVTKGQNESR